MQVLHRGDPIIAFYKRAISRFLFYNPLWPLSESKLFKALVQSIHERGCAR
jgi:hypothetical protein